MPEQLTKHPEVTLRVLRSAGAKCGEGITPQILVQCPAARFCQLPGGEVCVYGLPDAVRMTQINAADWRALQLAPRPDVQPLQTVPLGTLLLAIVGALVAGMLLAGAWSRRRHRTRPSP